MNQQIDVQSINHSADVLSLSGVSLKRISSSGGGEWTGACPFCGGKDRFRVQPNEYRWLCRKCTGGKWQDAIALGRRLWAGASFREVCERLSGGNLPTVTGALPVRTPPPPKPAYAAPEAEWQRNMAERCDKWQAALWGKQGTRALDWLHRRGLEDDTIRRFRLGFRGDNSYFHGVVIPACAAGKLWYVKYRRPTGEPKYICEKGSQPAAVFNGDELQGCNAALFVEGEFDSMIAWQAFGDMIPTVTLGSATNTPDLATWGKYLIAPQKTLILPDNDAAGEVGAARVASLSRNPVLVGLPEAVNGKSVKDLTDFYQAGGDIRQWALDLLRLYDPLPAQSLIEYCASLGGIVEYIYY